MSSSKSKGLLFLEAAAAAMPKSLGDRAYIRAMDSAMELAIYNRMAFNVADGPALKKLNHLTCVGHFTPMARHWYRRACGVGGTYPAMWEKENGERAWKAPFAIFREFDMTGAIYKGLPFENNLLVLQNNRVCAGMGVIVPMALEDDPEAGLDRFDNYELAPKGETVSGQVWWMTSADDAHATLCRYKAGSAAPVRRKKVTREEWTALVSA